MAGYVYLIGSPVFNWYKIGRSRLPHLRVKNLGILLPFKIELIATWFTIRERAMERELHEKYQANHINGEWFYFTHKQIKEMLLDVPCAEIHTGTTFTDKVVNMKKKPDLSPEERELRKRQAITEREKKKSLA